MTKRRICLIPLLTLLLVSLASAQNVARTITSFDPGWKFLKSDAEGAEKADFSDATWRNVDVPHDWAIEGPFEQSAPTRGSGANAPSGISWYRKTFTLPADQSAKRFFIQFDGVMANSDVYINGQLLGHRPYGYSSFEYDMTGKLNFGPGKTNVLAVRTDTAQQPASRWYEGAGIYRHVRLVATDPVHIEQWGTFVTTPEVSPTAATVHVRTTVRNQSEAPQQVAVQAKVLGPDGSTVGTGQAAPQTINPGASIDFDQDIKVNAPRIWDIASPVMNKVVASVTNGGRTIDDEVVQIGIRSFEFKTESGFWLNDKNFKLLGVCLHCDGGAFGIAVPKEVWRYRLANLRELGVNAIRTAHNPPAPEFLDVCDEMGFLVMDEDFDCWTVGKNTFDYHLFFNEWHLRDLADMVKRDRNHPSIVLYSAGNEIHDTPREALALSLLKPMVDEFHKNDPTRPVTQALFRPNTSHDYTNGLADLLDVIGTNYRDVELIQAWKDKPGRKIIGTEQGHELNTWLNLRDNPQHSGQFLWSGIDYMGEALGWPNITAASGLLDRTGFVKNNGLQRQSWWASKPAVNLVRSEIAPAAPPAPPEGEAAPAARGARAGRGGRGGAGGRGSGGPFPDWSPSNPAADAPVVLTVYSNCDQVELFLNDMSLGAKDKPANDSPRVWQTVYSTGTLKAVGKNKGQVVATDVLKTAGAPAKIVLTTHKTSVSPSYEDVVVVTAQLVDANGVPCPNESGVIKFDVKGPGTVAAIDNGNNASSEPFQASERPSYRGRVVAFIKATAASGPITVSAASDGVTGASTTLQTTAK